MTDITSSVPRERITAQDVPVDSATAQYVPGETNSAEYEAMAKQLLVEMERLQAGMQKDRHEIEWLKEDTSRLEAENRIVLTRLKAMW